MDVLTQIELASFENVQPPRVEKSNFQYSFSFLPRDERNAISSIYAFCSYIDDIVDNSPCNNSFEIKKKNERLDWWENVIENIYDGEINNHLLNSFVRVVRRFDIPKQYFLTLINGCRKDLFQRRYETFEELKEYCYGVASIIGLISIEIFGHKYENTKNYAINLGYALQLTNILRDIKADKNRGYIYIPKEDLIKFNYSEEDLINEVYNDNFVELMEFEVQRARDYYHKARTHLHPGEKINILTAEIMDAIYYRLLEKIELNKFNIFNKKIKVSSLHKLLIVFKYWLSMKVFIKRFKKETL